VGGGDIGQADLGMAVFIRAFAGILKGFIKYNNLSLLLMSMNEFVQFLRDPLLSREFHLFRLLSW
jgi:hypothetical protein